MLEKGKKEGETCNTSAKIFFHRLLHVTHVRHAEECCSNSTSVKKMFKKQSHSIVCNGLIKDPVSALVITEMQVPILKKNKKKRSGIGASLITPSLFSLTSHYVSRCPSVAPQWPLGERTRFRRGAEINLLRCLRFKKKKIKILY